MAGPTWTATNGGLIGGGAGLVAGAGIGYAIGHAGGGHAAPAAAAPASRSRPRSRPARRHAHAHENPATMVATTLGGFLGTAIGGLVGAMLGKRSQFNAWNAASQQCGQTQIADWATFQCTNFCPDDSVPVNGQCSGYVPKSSLFGVPPGVGAGAPMGIPQLSPRSGVGRYMPARAYGQQGQQQGWGHPANPLSPTPVHFTPVPTAVPYGGGQWGG